MWRSWFLFFGAEADGMDAMMNEWAKKRSKGLPPFTLTSLFGKTLLYG